MTRRRFFAPLWLPVVVAAAAVVTCLAGGDCALRTPDRVAYQVYESGDYGAAAAAFADPMWRGTALFRQGEFEQAAGVFSGFDTAEAAFNQGNALVMLGKYEEAVARYGRALELRPGWDDATVNRDIATARAARLKREGGEGTGGKLGADDIVLSGGKSSASGEEQVDAAEPLSDQELRSIWLRQVQTKPADFLRAKFAYQYATRPASSEGTEE